MGLKFNGGEYMKRLAIAAMALGVALAAQPLCAQEQEKEKGTTAPAAKKEKMNFATLDANKDGKVTREEWKGRAKRFDRLDTNRDGSLTMEEMKAGRKKKK